MRQKTLRHTARLSPGATCEGYEGGSGGSLMGDAGDVGHPVVVMMLPNDIDVMLDPL